MKIALVHDFLKEYGGAERVLEAMHEIWPEAPIYTAFVDYEGLGPHADRIARWSIKTTWAQSIPFISKLYSPLRFLAPFFFRSLDLRDYDVIISSTNAYYAKGVRIHPSPQPSPARVEGASSPLMGEGKDEGEKKPIHICYCHTPPRSLYGYPTAMDWRKTPIIRLYGTIVNHFLRIYDFKVAQNVDYFIANSEEVKRRIKKFYRRDSDVIYPPVDVRGPAGRHPRPMSSVSASWSIPAGSRRGSPAPVTPHYYLYVGKLAYAKHVDLAVASANRLKVPLRIVGKGGEEVRLRQTAGPTVEFLGEVSDEELHNLYVQSKALIFPAEDEDFGIVPVEAMAYGVPVIAHRSGGVVESVVDPSTSSGQAATGVFFDELTVESVCVAIHHLNDLDHQSMQEACIKQAGKFSKERFKKEILAFVNEVAYRVQ